MGRAVIWEDQWCTLTTFWSHYFFRALNLKNGDSYNTMFLVWLSAAKERLVPSSIIYTSINKLFGTESVWRPLPKFPLKVACPSKRSWRTSFAACTKYKPFWSPPYKSAAKIASVAISSDAKTIFFPRLWACKPEIHDSSYFLNSCAMQVDVCSCVTMNKHLF